MVRTSATLTMISEKPRPSRIHMAITSDSAGAITRVQVGGQSVLVAKGTLTL